MSTKQKKEQPRDPAEVLAPWLERDLSEAAEDDLLFPAFEVDDLVGQAADLVAQGQCPVLSGPSGVGKTAIVYQLVREAHAGRGPESLRDRHVVQLSIRRRAAGLSRTQDLRPEMEALVEALITIGPDIVPFFRDLHLIYDFDLEGLLLALAFRFPGVMLAEADEAKLDAMLEMSPELESHFVPVRVDEPGLDRARRVLVAWSDELARRNGTQFTAGALDQALQLTHRFLARSHLPRKAVELLGRSSTGIVDRGVTEKDVIESFCTQHRVPPSLVDPNVSLGLPELEAEFRSSVLGQPEAIRAVVSVLSMVKAGLSDVRRPFGVFLFVGPTGVGKTHVAQLLARFIFGTKDRMVRLDMADYQNGGDDRVLFGDPDGMVAARERGVLTRRLMGHPFAVLLLDEFEKAHPMVKDRFLQLFDEGRFVNGAGQSVSCRSSIIIATSNAGAELYRGHGLGFGDPKSAAARRQALERRLEESFRFELLNRFDQVVHFQPLSRSDIRTIARRELEQLEERAGIQQSQLTLDIDEAVLDWLVAHGYDPQYGARFLRRSMERHVTTALADAIVRQAPAPGTAVTLSVRGNRVVARARSDRSGEGAAEEVKLAARPGRPARSLDVNELRDEARSLVAAAQPLFDDEGERRREHSELLALMNAPGFWDDPDGSREPLARFRELDVALHVDARCGAPLRDLADRLEASAYAPGNARALAAMIDRADRALRDWQERRALEGESRAWLVVSSANPLRPAGQWIADVASMELAWCSSLHLIAEVVAFEIVEDELARVVLDVEGPGAADLLAVEAGIHRLVRPQRDGAKARVEVLPKSDGDDPCPGVHVTKPRAGALGVTARARGRAVIEERGLALELAGTEPESLAHLLGDLERAWRSAPEPETEVARVYGDGGPNARDPRTGVVVSRLKDVLRGRLEPFLDAWRRSRHGAGGSAS